MYVKSPISQWSTLALDQEIWKSWGEDFAQHWDDASSISISKITDTGKIQRCDVVGRCDVTAIEVMQQKTEGIFLDFYQRYVKTPNTRNKFKSGTF